MVFYIFTFIVFLAELVLAFAIVIFLLKMNNMFKSYNSLLDELKPKIGDLLKTVTKISEQMVELAPIVVEKMKSIFTNMLMGQLKSALAGLTFWLVKTEVEKHVNQ